MTTKVLHFTSSAAVALLAITLAQAVRAQQPPAIGDGYPSGWEIRVPPGTELAKIKSTYETRRQPMSPRDLEDRSPLPFWFRLYLRDQLPNLPSNGSYQYPRVAAQILEWMVTHPTLTVPRSARNAATRRRVPTIKVGTNINLTNLDERNSESFVAVDYSNPQFVVAASNNLSGSGRQKQFFSSDGGTSWSSTELPLAPGKAFMSDPALAFTTDGTAWAATLGINERGSSVELQVYKSTDHGQTWAFTKTVSSGNDNDKEMIWVDTGASSPHKDNIYVAWDVPGQGMRFARSTDKGANWSSPMTLSSDAAIGSHLTTGPDGAVYVAWPDTQSRELRIRRSADGGATFDPAKVIATTNDSYEVSIPAMCQRKVLIYVTIGVDRSNGPRKGAVYATWGDRNGSDPDPGCAGAGVESNSNVYFSASTDGGQTWTKPKIVHADQPSTDQFNPWMDVDPDDGTIHVVFYDTREDAARKQTNVFYVESLDGGASWVNETKVTTMPSDETANQADSGNQYGDYGGLAVYRGVAHPTWTDRRTGTPGGKEQIFTSTIGKKKPPTKPEEKEKKKPDGDK